MPVALDFGRSPAPHECKPAIILQQRTYSSLGAGADRTKIAVYMISVCWRALFRCAHWRPHHQLRS